MEGNASNRYVFDEFTLDVSRASLLRGGEPVSLRPKAFDALEYLVEHRGRLATKDELIKALWPNVIVTDDSLAKCVQEVRDALDDRSHRYVKTIPRRGYIFDAPVVVDRPTPHADEEAPAVASHESTDSTGPEPMTAGPQARRKRRLGAVGWAASATAVLAAIGGGALYWLERSAATSPAADQSQPAAGSVAVLPFVSISADAGEDYFSDGVSEELITVLANIPGLHVPSRTSSFAFKGTSTDLRTIAVALNVDHVLEGSVRKAGDQVRITAQLIDVVTDSHVWSATYDRELTDIFRIQDEIAQSVAGALRIELAGGELPEQSSARTASFEAHDAYLRGLHYIRTQRSEDIAQARTFFERAIELDPEYAAAHAELALALLTAHMYGAIDADEAFAQAAQAISRALALDADLDEAHLASGALNSRRGDVSAADADYRRAIELNPALSRAYYGRLLTSASGDESRASLEKALELDPLNGLFNWWMGNVWLQQGDAERAQAYYRRAVEFEPMQPNAYSGLGDVEIMSGRLDEGLRWFLEGLQRDPGQAHMTAIIGLFYRSLGDLETAQLWFDRGAALYGARPLQRFFREFMPLVVRNEDPAMLLAVLRDIPVDQVRALGGRIFRKAALATGDLDGIEAFYRQNWPQLFVPEPPVNAYNYGVATDLAWLAVAQGQTERALVLLDRALAVARDPTDRPPSPVDWGLVMIETEALALRGDKDAALAALRRAIDAGWRWDWWQVETDPTLAAIASEPEFAAMIAEVKADLAAQLERVREMERNGDLPNVPEPSSAGVISE